MIVVNDWRRINPEKGILDFKRMLLKVLWMALIAGLIGNDETLASYKKKHWTYQIQDQSAKTILSLRPKWPKSYSISDENVLRLVYNQVTLSAIKIRWVFPHAKLMISWLQWLQKRWGARANWWAIAIFQLTELNVKANRPCFWCARSRERAKWRHKSCAERMRNANVGNHLKRAGCLGLKLCEGYEGRNFFCICVNMGAYHSTNLGTNGTEISWEKFQKIRKRNT